MHLIFNNDAYLRILKWFICTMFLPRKVIALRFKSINVFTCYCLTNLSNSCFIFIFIYQLLSHSIKLFNYWFIFKLQSHVSRILHALIELYVYSERVRQSGLKSCQISHHDPVNYDKVVHCVLQTSLHDCSASYTASHLLCYLITTLLHNLMSCRVISQSKYDWNWTGWFIDQDYNLY